MRPKAGALLLLIRKALAKRLAKAALKLDPKSPEVVAFYAKQVFDMAVHGGAITHIDYNKVTKDKP
jgi:hypothetical protein